MDQPNPLTAPTAAPSAIVLEGIQLVVELAHIRNQRTEGAAKDTLQQAVTLWNQHRTDWWHRIQSAHEAGEWIPLAILVQRLALQEREVDLLLIALAPHVDPEILDILLGANPSFFFRGISEGLALSLLFHTPEERFAGQQLLSPASPLIRHGLLERVPIGTELTPHAIELKSSESFRNFVLDRPLISGPISQYCELHAPTHTYESVVLPPEKKQRLWEVISGSPGLRSQLDGWGYGTILPKARGLVLLFSGPPGTGKSMFAHAIANRLERQVLAVHTSRLLASRESIRPILTEAFRVATLCDAVVLIDDCESLLDQRDARFLALLECLDQHEGLLVLTTNNAPSIDFAMERRIQFRLDFESPSPMLREHIWEVHLPPEAPLSEDIDVPTLANAYEFTGARIRNTVLLALAKMQYEEADKLSMAILREAAETQLGARLDGLAVRSQTQFGLDRLILPDAEQGKIKEVLSACRHREYVLSRWGFGRSLTKGRGLCVLFDGPPGTGKTFAAELLAHELHLPLYRIHIPNIVSKWVGETERNISEIFSRARSARAVLLFDEADSLFGRRSSSQQSANDRYANMEVNLLLQEIEGYDGITFLTTNLFGNLDDALQRRIQFRVTFPFPEPKERANIWRVLTPPQAPLAEDVDFEDLGSYFELAGGHIKNALLRAAYAAREEDTIIHHRHLEGAALAECQAQGKIVRAPVVSPEDEEAPSPAPEPSPRKKKASMARKRSNARKRSRAKARPKK